MAERACVGDRSASCEQCRRRDSRSRAALSCDTTAREGLLGRGDDTVGEGGGGAGGEQGCEVRAAAGARVRAA